MSYKMQNIAHRIKAKLEEKGLSAYKLEKRTGLKRSAVNNILYGRSKSPSVGTIQAIAEGLNCSIADLLGNDVWYSEPSLSEEDGELFSLLNALPEDQKLYLQALEVVGKALEAHFANLSRKQIFKCIEEVYSYSLKAPQKKVDAYFVEWIVEKLYLNK